MLQRHREVTAAEAAEIQRHYDEHPTPVAYAVACPVCKAAAGSAYRGRLREGPHKERQAAAKLRHTELRKAP